MAETIPELESEFSVRGIAGLRFREPAVERQFKAAYVDKTLVAMRFAVVAGAVMYGLFGLLDGTVAAPAELPTLRLIRFGVVVPLLLAVVAATFSRAARPHLLVIVAGGVAIGGVGIIAIMQAASGPRVDTYYAGLFLVQIFAYTVTQLPFVHATVVSWGVTLLYDAVAIAQGTEAPVLLSQNFFLVAGNGAGMVAGWFMERLRRRDFAAQLTLSRERAQLERLASELEFLARRDPLTGLLNRRELDGRLQSAIDLRLRYGVDTSLVLVDLDAFKAVNDTCGHATGDALLIASADALRHCTRTTDQVFRFGGDEFLILAPETPVDVAVHMAHRILKSFSELYVPGMNAGSTVSCSIGVSGVLDEDAAPAAVLARVDDALYAAKRQGKARAIVAPPPAARVGG